MNDGVGLAVEVAGDGPGLLLVHGFGGAKEDFADHVPTLARDHTVVIFDHRGHGASDKPTDPAAYSLDRLVADTLAVADATGLDHFRLLGHSMGGMVARKIAIHEPSRVDALVMMDTSAGPIPGFDPELVDIGVEVALTQGKQALEGAARLGGAAGDARVQAARCASVPATPSSRRASGPTCRRSCGARSLRELAYQTDDLPAMAASLRAPLLVIVGAQDKPFVIASHAMAEAIPARSSS